jgi:hypothetical protein
VFSNGTEYEIFLDDNCMRCKKYVWWEEANDEKPCCPTEETIALANRETFPYDKLNRDPDTLQYDCKELELKDTDPTEPPSVTAAETLF